MIMNREFQKMRTRMDVAISSITFIVGIVLVVLPTSVSINIFGSCMIVVGILLVTFLKTGWQDTETKEYYCKKKLFFHQKNKSQLLKALEEHAEIMAVSDKENGDGLMMEIYYNRQNKKAYINLFEFVPYEYKTIGLAFEYSVDEIEKLIGIKG